MDPNLAVGPGREAHTPARQAPAGRRPQNTPQLFERLSGSERRSTVLGRIKDSTWGSTKSELGLRLKGPIHGFPWPPRLKSAEGSLEQVRRTIKHQERLPVAPRKRPSATIAYVLRATRKGWAEAGEVVSSPQPELLAPRPPRTLPRLQSSRFRLPLCPCSTRPPCRSAPADGACSSEPSDSQHSRDSPTRAAPRRR